MGHTCVHDESSRVRAREEFCGRALATPLTRSQRRQRCRRRKRRRLEMHHPGGALFQTGLCGRPCRQIRSLPLRRRNRCRPNLCRSGCLPRLVLSRFQNPPELMGYLGLVRAEFDWQQVSEAASPKPVMAGATYSCGRRLGAIDIRRA
jgi:hypothetical protein